MLFLLVQACSDVGGIVATYAYEEEAQRQSARRGSDRDQAGRHATEPNRRFLDRDARGARRSLEANRCPY
jgi:hypothetical protein